VLVGGHQLIPVVHSHTASDDLANTGHEHVDTLSDTAVLGSLLHVEGLDVGGEVGQEDGLVDDIGHATLSSLSNIVTELVGLALLVGDLVFDQPLDSIVVLHATEGTGRGLEIRIELLDISSDLGLSQSVVNHAADHILEVVKQVSEGDEVQLGFDVRVLRQVAAGQRLLGTERRAHTVHITQGGETCLQVQLGGLGQVGILAVVVESEQSAATLDLGLHHGGRSHLQHAGLLECLAESPQSSGAHLHDGGGGLTAQHQVAVVVESLRVGVRRHTRGNSLLVASGLADDLEEVGVQLAVVGRMLLGGHGAHLTVDGHGGFEGEGHDVVGLDHVTGQDALQVPIAVGESDEDDILLGAGTVNSAQNADSGASLIGLGGAQLDDGRVGDVQTNAHGLGQRRVLLNDDLLGLLQDLLTLVGLGLLADGQFLFLGGLLLALLPKVVGLLHCRLGGGLPLQFGSGVDILPGGVGLGLASEVLDAFSGGGVFHVGVDESFVGGGLGTVGGGLVSTDVFVDVDGGRRHDVQSSPCSSSCGGRVLWEK
jgi:hypothetical protein